ncbi:MAG: transglutaminase family protein [Lachnospiraceae bacterium]|nr:transglutaminase family protein [Ruminococcus sp.]MCM1275910.1 transglutaminase family protein [Lachnospiraceae bacterium]
MKRLRFEYSARLEFAESVSEHCFTLRCLPVSDGRQLIREPRREIFPNCGRVWTSRDSFGNTLLCGRIPEPHGAFSFRVSGEAEIINARDISGYPAAVYGYASPLTKAGARIREFYAENTPRSENELDRAMELCAALYSAMRYEKGVTDVRTTAEDALALGAGVCQDYAHIFLSLCRLDGIRCRYVSGLAFDRGETHAWTEVGSGSRWFGIDPANNRFIGENYIKICHGRDYSDCPIERGIYLGNAAGVQTVTSSVIEI